MKNKPGHAIRTASLQRSQTYSPNHYRESLEESVDAQISEYVEELREWEKSKEKINSVLRGRENDG